MLLRNDPRTTGINKETFLTIPDALNYEINGLYQVRNKKTGLILKNYKGDCRLPMVSVYRNDGRQLKHPVNVFYHQALMNKISPEGWCPVSSLNNRYEVNVLGELRNAQSKKLVKLQIKGDCYYYKVCVDGKDKGVLRARLVDEVFGTGYERKIAPIPVILRKDGQTQYFKSRTAAARYLSSKVFYSVGYIANYMSKRTAEICGYSVQYLK